MRLKTHRMFQTNQSWKIELQIWRHLVHSKFQQLPIIDCNRYTSSLPSLLGWSIGRNETCNIWSSNPNQMVIYLPHFRSGALFVDETPIIRLMDKILHQFFLVNIPLFTGFYTSQVVQNFVHQQYNTKNNSSTGIQVMSSQGPPITDHTRGTLDALSCCNMNA